MKGKKMNWSHRRGTGLIARETRETRESGKRMTDSCGRDSTGANRGNGDRKV